MQDIIDPRKTVQGRVRMFKVHNDYGTTPAGRTRLPGVWHPKTGFEPNLVLYDWATIAGTLLTTGNNAYRIAGMYIEFENVGSPSDAVTAPDFTRYDGISYYTSLSTSSNKDFLRVPLVASSLLSQDTSKWPEGNLAQFFAQTVAGTGVGMFGKPFNDTAISKVYGAALVAMPVQGDYTQDLVFSRFYFSSGSQQVKLATSQLGLQWEIALQ